MAKKNKINFTAVLAAAGSGAAFTAGMEAAARNNDFLQENYLVSKGAAGVGIGTAILYFGSASEEMKAAGYGIIGAGGGALGSKLTTMMADQAEDEPAQGVRKMSSPQRMAMLRNVCERAAGNKGAQLARAGAPGAPQRKDLPAAAVDKLRSMGVKIPNMAEMRRGTFGGRRRHLYAS